MFKDFLENRIVDIKENLIMSSLQSDLDNSINKGDECTESVPNIIDKYSSGIFQTILMWIYIVLLFVITLSLGCIAF